MSNDDDDSGTWEAVKFESLRGRAVVVTCSLVVSVVASTFFTLLYAGSTFFYPDWEAAADSGDTFALVFVGVFSVSVFATIGILVLCWVSFLMWLHRAAKNARGFGWRRPFTSPTMTVACWFIPFLNLIRPYQVVKAIYWASEPAADDLPSDWVRRIPQIFPIWWMTWILGNIIEQVASKLEDSETMMLSPTAAWVGLLGMLFTTASALTAMAIVWSITVRQEALGAGRAPADSVEPNIVPA
jgi:hypothetical protein